MSPLAGPLYAAAALLAVAGAGKVARPDATRVALRQANLPNRRWMAQALGATEVAIGLGTIAIGGPIPAALTGASYAGFAWFAHRLDRATRGTAGCGCFGANSAPVGRLHVAVNVVIAAIAVAAAATDLDGIAAATDAPWAGTPFLGLTALLTWMVYVTLTALPAALDAARPKAAA
jgi:hypothetical protein